MLLPKLTHHLIPYCVWHLLAYVPGTRSLNDEESRKVVVEDMAIQKRKLKECREKFLLSGIKTVVDYNHFTFYLQITEGIEEDILDSERWILDIDGLLAIYDADFDWTDLHKEWDVIWKQLLAKRGEYYKEGIKRVRNFPVMNHISDEIEKLQKKLEKLEQEKKLIDNHLRRTHETPRPPPTNDSTTMYTMGTTTRIIWENDFPE